MVSRARPFALLWLAALECATGCSDIVGLECESGRPCEVDRRSGACVDGRCLVDDGTTTDTTLGESGPWPTSTTVEPVTTAVEETRGEEESETGATAVCGNGIVEEDEECEDGDLVDIDECSNACRLPVCGDGIVQTVEDCDLGAEQNFAPGSSCKPDCTPAICGDGVVRWGIESCDGGDLGGQTCESLGHAPGELWCTSDCTYDFSLCGPCWEMPVCDEWQPCEFECANGLPCFTELGPVGTCLPTCIEQGECPIHPEGYDAFCAWDVCVIPCVQACPEGMICTDTQTFGPVCLW